MDPRDTKLQILISIRNNSWIRVIRICKDYPQKNIPFLRIYREYAYLLELWCDEHFILKFLQILPPPITEEDAKKGILSLLQRGLIPPAADLSLDPSPVYHCTAPLHEPDERDQPRTGVYSFK